MNVLTVMTRTKKRNPLRVAPQTSPRSMTGKSKLVVTFGDG